MKAKILLMFVVLIAQPNFAQEQTLFIGKIEHGGYGSPVVKFTTINDKLGLLVGGQGGWIINHTLVLGGGGYGLSIDVQTLTIEDSVRKYVDFGYGGFLIEYVMNSDKLIHFAINTLIGGGYVGSRKARDDDDHKKDNEFHSLDDGFFVLEPGLTVDLNVTKLLRASVGVNYRYIAGVASGPSTNKDISGPSVMLMLRFGKF